MTIVDYSARVGEWKQALEPIIGKFKIAHTLNQCAFFNGEEALAMAELLTHMSELLNTAVEVLDSSHSSLDERESSSIRLKQIVDLLVAHSESLSPQLVNELRLLFIEQV